MGQAQQQDETVLEEVKASLEEILDNANARRNLGAVTPDDDDISRQIVRSTETMLREIMAFRILNSTPKPRLVSNFIRSVNAEAQKLTDLIKQATESNALSPLFNRMVHAQHQRLAYQAWRLNSMSASMLYRMRQDTTGTPSTDLAIMTGVAATLPQTAIQAGEVYASELGKGLTDTGTILLRDISAICAAASRGEVYTPPSGLTVISGGRPADAPTRRTAPGTLKIM